MMSETKIKYGNRLGFAIFHWILKLIGLTPAYLLLMLVTPYYIIFRPSVFRSSDHYLRRRFPSKSIVARYLSCFRYIYIFGQILIEQVSLGLLGSKRMKVSFPDRKKLFELSKRKKRGLVLLTTHVGPWQSVMATIDRMASNVYFYFDVENWEGGHFFDLASQREHFHFISPRNHLPGIIEATKVLYNGECLAVMGDIVETKNNIKAPFFNDEAQFPSLPYRLAVSTDSDIAVLLTARIGSMEYYIEYECLTEGLDKEEFSRGELESILAGRYAKFLERFLEKYPYMWFNFFDFWKKTLVKEERFEGGREIERAHHRRAKVA